MAAAYSFAGGILIACLWPNDVLANQVKSKSPAANLNLLYPKILRIGNLNAAQVSQYHAELQALNKDSGKDKKGGEAMKLARTATLYARLNKISEAASQCQKALSVEPTNQEAAIVAYTLACKYHNDLEEEQELKFLNLTIQACPDQSHLYKERGELLHGMDREQEAMADQNKAIALDAKNWAAYQGRGQIECSTGKMAAAIADFERTIKLHPDSMTALMSVSQCYESEKNYPQALASFDRILKLKMLDPVDRLKALDRKAEILSETGQTAAALKQYTEIIEAPLSQFKSIERSAQFSTLSRALQGRTRIWLAQKNYPAAITDYSALIRYEKDWGEFEPKWYLERAKLYRLTNRPDLAARDESAARHQ